MSSRRARFDAVVIGGGFFGCSLALRLRELGRSVVVIERENDLLQRASYANQARIHRGYHYPRSILTGLRSSVNFARFQSEYHDCVVSSFRKLYAIARQRSNITAAQFRTFCERIGAPTRRASPRDAALFDSERVEAVFEVEEHAFDAVRLREHMRREIERNGANLLLGCGATLLSQRGGEIAVTLSDGSEITGREVIVATYSQLNQLLHDSGLPLVPLKHELAEIALVRVPPPLASVGITVMCGPFFSTMPFPPLGLHTLSHVRYTPHCEWHDRPGETFVAADDVFDGIERRSRFAHMLSDARRFVPLLAEAEYERSLWEVKTVLPQSETDDSRPMLFRRNHGLPNLTLVMGAKIDNVYDVLYELAPAEAMPA